MSDFTKLHLSHKIFRILPVFSQFFYRRLITSVGLEKCKKMQCSLNYSGTRFCPLKIKITQFPGVFRLKALRYGIYRKVR